MHTSFAKDYNLFAKDYKDFGFILSSGGPQSLINNYKLQKKLWKLKVCNDLFGSKTWRDVKRGRA